MKGKCKSEKNQPKQQVIKPFIHHSCVRIPVMNMAHDKNNVTNIMMMLPVVSIVHVWDNGGVPCSNDLSDMQHKPSKQRLNFTYFASLSI